MTRAPSRRREARDVVMTRVARRAQDFPKLFPGTLDVEGLEPRDQRLAFALDQVVARRWLTLSAVVESQLKRPWEDLHPTVQAALLVGAAQLLLLERIPDHAAINESVAWAKQARERSSRTKPCAVKRPSNRFTTRCSK